MKNLSLRNKLIILLAIPVIGLLVLAYVGATTSTSTAGNFEDVVTVSLPIVKTLEEIKVAGSQLLASANEIVLNDLLDVTDDDAPLVDVEFGQYETAREELAAALDAYQQTKIENEVIDVEIAGNVEAQVQSLLGPQKQCECGV